MPAAVFELSRKSGRGGGGIRHPPSAGHVLKLMLEGLRKKRVYAPVLHSSECTNVGIFDTFLPLLPLYGFHLVWIGDTIRQHIFSSN